ncbi:AraC family transcriptional regulator [Rhodopirellula halodulae]|uniref:AraC family transcriptional regulator n=1 Tax=Rhodopirellula halodulae TaxID=2894198 RepID=UPI001E48319C|nr:AraC family transcriptional regulator [Rhodopirellula sp. JC737]MCC9658657.1 AraC family transcriptional regulator [Rhodopirellula sp. JC737]
MAEFQEPEFVSKQTVEASHFYLDLDPDPHSRFTVVCGGMERTSLDYVIRRSDFPFWGLEFVDQGEGRLQLENEWFDLKRGTVFAYGPGVRHRIENSSQTGMRKYYLDMSGTDAKRLLQEADLLSGYPLHVRNVKELTDLFQMIATEGKDDQLRSRDIVSLITRAMIIKIAQRRSTSEGDSPKAYEVYQDIRQYMDDNYRDLTSIAEVADQCGYTTVYVSRLFKRYAARGAYQYLLRLRMNYAADLLFTQGMKVRDVAEMLKFADAFQFSRAFKRVYGVPPSQLKRSR